MKENVPPSRYYLNFTLQLIYLGNYNCETKSSSACFDLSSRNQNQLNCWFTRSSNGPIRPPLPQSTIERIKKSWRGASGSILITRLSIIPIVFDLSRFIATHNPVIPQLQHAWRRTHTWGQRRVSNSIRKGTGNFPPSILFFDRKASFISDRFIRCIPRDRG